MPPEACEFDFLEYIPIILAVIGGLFAYYQWFHSNKNKRAELINEIIEKLRFSDELIKTMYLIDYSSDWYSADFHNSKDSVEKEIDSLLSYLSYICFLRKMNMIKRNEFSIFEYELNRVCNSKSVLHYLWNIYHFSKKINVSCSFNFLIDYAKKNKFLKKSFFENNSDYFDKYLNF